MQDGCIFLRRLPSHIVRSRPDPDAQNAVLSFSALRLGRPVCGRTRCHPGMIPNPFDIPLRAGMLDGRTVDGIRHARGGSGSQPVQRRLRLVKPRAAPWFVPMTRDACLLMPGMLADLAVLSADYLSFSVPVLRIAQIESLLTMVGGPNCLCGRSFSAFYNKD